jgi:hypothetical protein
METIKHSTGAEVVVAYFGDLKEKLSVSTGYVRGMNAYNQMMSRKDGILRTTLSEDAGHKAIVKDHNKFYGDSKYDGRGNLKVSV